jgi:hypothetical protein
MKDYTELAPDVPAGVGYLLFISYAVLIVTFAIATVSGAYAAFMVAVAAICASSLYFVPTVMMSMEPKSSPHPSMAEFFAKGMQTATGHATGRDALTQMLLVPVLLTFGAAAIGVIVAVVG